MPQMQRRVIAGIDPDGRSCILIDGPSQTVIWSSAGSPADNGGAIDAGGRPFTADIPVGGTSLSFHSFAPGAGAGMHATDTLDYIIIVSGQVTFITETGEVVLRAGDVLVDRGVLHAWRNDGDTTCRFVNVMMPAIPIDRRRRD